MSTAGIHASNKIMANLHGLGDLYRRCFERSGGLSPMAGITTVDLALSAELAWVKVWGFRTQKAAWGGALEDNPPPDEVYANPKATARRWIDLQYKIWKLQNPRPTFFITGNEQDPPTPQHAALYDEYTLETMRYWDSLGHPGKLGIYGFAGGNPKAGPRGEWTTEEMWEAMLPSARYAMEHGHWITLHNHPTGFKGLKDSGEYCALRHRVAVRVWQAHGLPVEKAQVALTETSVNGVGGLNMEAGGNWLDEIRWLDRELMSETPRVVKYFSFYQAGGDEDIRQAFPGLEDYVVATPTPPESAPIDPPPPPASGGTLPYPVVAYLMPQVVTPDEETQVMVAARPTKSDILRSADSARFLAKHGQPGSKVISYGSDRWPGGQAGLTAFFNPVPVDHREFKSLGEPFWGLTPIRTIKTRITDKFAAPRPTYPLWSNREHEGLDLDAFDDTLLRAVQIYAIQAGVVETAVTQWNGTVGYGRHITVMHDWVDADGTIHKYRSWYCHMERVDVKVGQAVTPQSVLGVAGKSGTSAIHLHLMIQDLRDGPANQGWFTPYVIDPLPLLRMVTVPDAPPPTTISNPGFGLHMNADGHLNALDLQVVRGAGIHWAKITSSASPTDMDSLIQAGVPASQVMMRLFADFRGRKVTPAEFVDWMSNGPTSPLAWFSQKGGKLVEIHNEPNLPDEAGLSWSTPQEFAEWYRQVLAGLRKVRPELRYGFPGLSPQPNVPDYVRACKEVIRQSDWMGLHCYWGAIGTYTDPDNGHYFQRFLDGQYHTEFYITECSNNAQQVLSADYERKGHEYVSYWKSITDSRIRALFFFISQATNPAFAAESWVVQGKLTPIVPIVAAR